MAGGSTVSGQGHGGSGRMVGGSASYHTYPTVTPLHQSFTPTRPAEFWVPDKKAFPLCQA